MLTNSIIAALLGLALAAYYANKVLSIKVTDSKVEELSSSIREGSMAFLKRMYSWISVFVVVLAVLISTLTEWGYPWGSVAFVAGALLSSLAGKNAAFHGNGRDAISKSLKVREACFSCQPSRLEIIPASLLALVTMKHVPQFDQVIVAPAGQNFPVRRPGNPANWLRVAGQCVERFGGGHLPNFDRSILAASR